MKRRIKGEGYLFKRNGVYYIRQIVNGKRITKSLKTGNKSEASAALELYKPIINAKSKEELAFRIGEARNVIKKGLRVKADEAWDCYLKSNKRLDHTKQALKDYEGYFSRFIAALDVVYLDQISEDAARDYLQGLKVSNRTHNKNLQVLKLIFSILQPESNPFAQIRGKMVQSVSKRDFTEKQIEEIFKVFDLPGINLMHREELRLMFMIGRWTGLRMKDCALLKWEDVDLKRKLIKVKTHKTETDVIIPIHKELKAVLSAIEQEGKHVLPGIAKRYGYNSSGVNKDCMKVLSLAGIKTTEMPAGSKRQMPIVQYGFHSFRHSFVSFCAKAGVPMAFVQAIVGHGSPAMTRHYTHIGVDTLRNAMERI